MSRKLKQLDLGFINELAPSDQPQAAKQNWQEMKSNKRTMRERRNRKRNYN